MKSAPFLVKSVLFTLLFAVCFDLLGQSQTVSTALDLKEQREDPAIRKIPIRYLVVVVLVADEKWYGYSDTSLHKGKSYSPKEFREWLDKKKKSIGDSIHVILKPSSDVTYKGTVDALDEMTTAKIKKFSMVRMSRAEEKMFPASGRAEEMDQVAIEAPTLPVETSFSHPYFIIELRKDQSVWYSVRNTQADSTKKRLNDPVKGNLSRLIADFKKNNEGKSKDFLVKGDKESKYKQFEEVIDALRENNEFKYILINSEN